MLHPVQRVDLPEPLRAEAEGPHDAGVGLPPLPPGHTYQLWFLTAAGPVSGGTFHAAAGADAEIGSPTMPGGIVGFAVTLEPAPGVTQPTGPRVLLGSEPVEIL